MQGGQIGSLKGHFLKKTTLSTSFVIIVSWLSIKSVQFNRQRMEQNQRLPWGKRGERAKQDIAQFDYLIWGGGNKRLPSFSSSMTPYL